jgi:lactate 2-monooxygenase
LPVLVKGILHPDDARRVFGLGLDGIVVSNHGGRQVDSAVAALDALVAVRHAVGSEPGRDQVLKRENTRLRSWPY